MFDNKQTDPTLPTLAATPKSARPTAQGRAQCQDEGGDPVQRLQRSCGNRSVQRLLAQTSGGQHGDAVDPKIERAIAGKRGGGQTLDRGVRGQMEAALATDLGGVRVHTDTAADQLNRQLSARAFTTGQDVFFRQGAYSPGSSAGRELLAHELTHVAQQSGGLQTKLTLGEPGDPYERQADAVAREVMQREQHTSESAQGQVARQAEEEEEANTKLQPHGLQRQSEDEEELQTKCDGCMGRQEDEEELQGQREAGGLRRQEDEEDTPLAG